MNWYVAKLIFRITCDNGNHQPQFDEQLIMENKGRSAFRWDFITMSELYQLDELRDGSEIYCNILDVTNAEEYIKMSHQKALLIGQNQQTGVTTTI